MDAPAQVDDDDPNNEFVGIAAPGARAEIAEVETGALRWARIGLDLVAGEDGVLDFAGFNTGYQQFFGSDINPMKPVRSFVQVAALVREGWLAEVEIRAARVPE